jgi:hypothetical protein
MADNAIPEVEAITALLKVLGPLKPDERENVIDFVFRKLGIERASPRSPVDEAFQVEKRADELEPRVVHSSVVKRAPPISHNDIRSLRYEKQPKTTSEMLALVAYYLEHIAPEEERRNYITADDISRYFKMGDFKLPSAPPRITIANAKNAGYFNATATRGQYKLNPVGYNLVVHKMPTDGTPARKRSKKRKVNKAKGPANER